MKTAKSSLARAHRGRRPGVPGVRTRDPYPNRVMRPGPDTIPRHDTHFMLHARNVQCGQHPPSSSPSPPDTPGRHTTRYNPTHSQHRRTWRSAMQCHAANVQRDALHRQCPSMAGREWGTSPPARTPVGLLAPAPQHRILRLHLVQLRHQVRHFLAAVFRLFTAAHLTDSPATRWQSPIQREESFEGEEFPGKLHLEVVPGGGGGGG